MLSEIAFYGAIETGLIYSLIAFSIYLSFRVLNFPDLTVEGSFPLGGAVAIALIVKGFNPWLSSLIAAMAGFLAGLITAYLNVKLKIMNLLAGILVMYGLYSINLRIMGRPNLPIISQETILTPFYKFNFLEFYQVPVLLFSLLILLISFLLYLFMKSELGLAMLATGENPKMARAQGISTGLMTILGMGVANALAGFSGALFAQSRGSADVSLGAGILVVGLASLIGGEAVLEPKTVLKALIACVLGSLIFRFIVALALNGAGENWGLKPSDINLITALLMLFAIKLDFFKSLIAKKFKK